MTITIPNTVLPPAGTPIKGLVEAGIYVRVGLIVGLAWDAGEFPAEARLREMLLANFLAHPALKDPYAKDILNFEVMQVTGYTPHRGRGRCVCQGKGFFNSGHRGVIAHIELDGTLSRQASVERCNACERFRTDDEAREFLLTKVKLTPRNPRKPRPRNHQRKRVS